MTNLLILLISFYSSLGGDYTAEIKIGRVKRFFPKKSVIVVEPEVALKVGDKIRITGEGSSSFKKAKVNFTQTVESIQLEHQQIEEAKPGIPVGIKVDQKAPKGCCVYLIPPI